MPVPSRSDLIGIRSADYKSRDPARVSFLKRRLNYWVQMSITASRIPRSLLIVLAAIIMCGLIAWALRLERVVSRVERRVSGSGTTLSLSSSEQKQLEALEQRYARLVEASLESRLLTLERSAQRGTLSAEDTRVLQEVTHELRFLREHTAQPSSAEHDPATANEHPRYGPVPAADIGSGAVLRQIDELRTFFYLLTVCVGIMAILAAGLWFGYRRRMRLIESPVQHQVPYIRALEQPRRRR